MNETLRLELRFRNNLLWHVIFDQYQSVAAFVRAAYPRAHDRRRVTLQIQIGALLNLKTSPYRSQIDGGLTKRAAWLCQQSGLGSGELFPPELYSGVLPRKAVAEIDHRRLLPLMAARRLALPATQDDLWEREELREALRVSMATLTPREARVLVARFGLRDGEELTCAEIAVREEVSACRINQIESEALRKMRHPRRSRRLRPFVAWRGELLPPIQTQAIAERKPMTRQQPPLRNEPALLDGEGPRREAPLAGLWPAGPLTVEVWDDYYYAKGIALRVLCDDLEITTQCVIADVAAGIARLKGGRTAHGIIRIIESLPPEEIDFATHKRNAAFLAGRPRSSVKEGRARNGV